ncbi:rhodanese-like domain-containing protein [Candidatus Nitronereus thalassa]|uniref:Rhodanese-like domain-containing protein n=1 Tax=Candidatus Nitronereus thalassa TaxID=3020898 RepID=A0ABU3K6Z8_9BACT|nr:rhodanese-like domain-containing protein [Candidatus Nitronereus thalassa]MDT7042113.1 rhodanese-like domain-containing protein [Candidatus Nitronereus thalassa]
MRNLKVYFPLLGFCSLFMIAIGSPAVAAEDFYVLSVHELNGGLNKAPSLAQKGFTLIDVRAPEEHSTGFIPGTDLNIDFREIGARHREIGARLDDHIVVYCQSGHRSNIAAETLASLGYTHVYNVAGSMNAWAEAGYPIQTVNR